ncbi:FAD-dependent oxidoreductase [Bifidobacterium coryneforme]|uniref:FAD-dependent pyridine nucleotide-disulfide oxidoreductase n=1 Tax=Bifidobacterium [indicum] DSM 20214 = LMG 11587 TaxID=1341694 RepID=A0A087VSI9_9BIFI|nr:FAD-dependent oxidoreductase [Bifidobacterium indicum]AIC91309.1 FAD-dependent pyridine nucleotide-disulfide oxidoreductase [Bifidobacterium indicum LMG 11587 = DSM 20214]
MKEDKNLYDVVIIGGGPAGLSAGLYLARARYRTLILEKDDFGGQITITADVVNYPGVARTDGHKLTETMRQQAQDFGAEFMTAEATGIDVDGDIKVVHTSRGDLRTFGVLIATGASPRKIGFEGEQEYAGRGVAYCATCDGEFFSGREVLVVGGGFAAAEESVFLTKYATKVTLLVREEDFTCDASVAAEARNNDKIEIHYSTELQGVSAGPGGLVEATLLDRTTGETKAWRPADQGTFGVFVFAGYVPQTGLVKGVVDLDDHGYVITHGYLETSVPGVYAAGDLRVKNLRQVITATSDGAVAAVELERYASDMSARTGLVPPRPENTPYEKSEKEAAESAAASGTSPAPVAQGTGNAPAKTSGFFGPDIRKQLDLVFGKMIGKLELALDLDGSQVSKELEAFVDELVGLSDGKLTSRVGSRTDEDGKDYDSVGDLPDARPSVRICRVDDQGVSRTTGLAFHGVPSGHEFNSFVLALYNVAGPGQQVDQPTSDRIDAIKDQVDVMMLVSLTCTMCPTTVLSAQRVAAQNGMVRAEAYDLAHFPELKDRYQVMSVPCIVIRKDGQETVEFGKKSVPEMLDLIGA